MDKPKIGDKVRIYKEAAEGLGDVITVGTVIEIYDDIDVWWNTAYGESKVALMDALEFYGPRKAATAEWYVMVEDDEDKGSVVALASFEVKQLS